MRGLVSAGVRGVMAVGLLLGAREAAACSFARNAHAVDPSEVGVDTTPPAPPVVLQVSVERAPRAQSDFSCDDLGTLRLQVRGEDDRTAPEQLGYRVRIVQGDTLLGELASEPVRAPKETLAFVWPDSQTREVPFTTRLEVRAVDLAGNESRPIEVVVAAPGASREQPFDPGALGCAASGAGVAWLALLGLLGPLRRKTSRA